MPTNHRGEPVGNPDTPHGGHSAVPYTWSNDCSWCGSKAGESCKSGCKQGVVHPDRDKDFIGGHSNESDETLDPWDQEDIDEQRSMRDEQNKRGYI